jgi:hypothetical protein
LLPRDGDGAGDGSFTEPFKLEDVSEDVGEVADDCGERPSTTGAEAGASDTSDNPHLVAEGAETLHAAGREVALVTFNTTPN